MTESTSRQPGVGQYQTYLVLPEGLVVDIIMISGRKPMHACRPNRTTGQSGHCMMCKWAQRPAKPETYNLAVPWTLGQEYLSPP